MAGLAKICKLYGRINIQDQEWAWDYVQNKARLEKEMTQNEKAASEKARWTAAKAAFDNSRIIELPQNSG